MLVTNFRPILLATALLSAVPLSAATVQSINYELDLHGQVAKEIRNDGGWTSYTYSPGGKRKTQDDDRGRHFDFDYDELGRLKALTAKLDGLTSTQLFDHDARDRLTKYTDPRGLVTTYEYNGFDEVIKRTSPDSGVSLVKPNNLGQTDTVTDAKQQVVKYHFDLAGRLDKLTYADQSTTTFGYGAGGERAGKLQLISDSQGDKISIPYDSLGRPMGEWRTLAGKEYITRENYDGAGRLKQRVYPSGRTVTYLFDPAGQINQILTQANATSPTVVIAKDIVYRPFGAAQNWTYGNGELHTSRYDLDGRLTQLSLGDSSLALTYDTGGRIRSQQISGGWWQRLLQRMGLPAGQQSQYGYDDHDRLTSWQDGTNSQSYSYDANGNRTQLTVNGKTFTQRIAANSNRLNSSDGPQANLYQYDANGSRISDSKQSYTYNARGRLVAAGGAQYVVNALGQRIIKTYQGQTTLYHYDRQGHLIAESDEVGNTKREYIYLDDTPLAVIDFGAVRYIHTDHLGTARLVTDATKRPIWAWQGEPFGNTAPNEDPEATGGVYAFNLRFPGQYYDKETGLYYNYFRDYDPAIGAYPQSDPIGLAGGINTYGYVGANPMSYSDPLGLMAIPVPPPPIIALPGGGTSGNSLDKDLGLTNSTSSSRTNDDDELTYVTYTRRNPATGQIYCGRSSGYGNPVDIVRRRGLQQGHLNAEGFLPPVLDRSSNLKWAIRGREQQLIDFYGGAQSVGGTTRNAINGVSDINPKGWVYKPAAEAQFGNMLDNSPKRNRPFW